MAAVHAARCNFFRSLSVRPILCAVQLSWSLCTYMILLLNEVVCTVESHKETQLVWTVASYGSRTFGGNNWDYKRYEIKL